MRSSVNISQQIMKTIKSIKLPKSDKSIYKPKYEDIINKLRLAREEAGLKQETVATKLGKYQSYLSKIEHGDRRIDIIELIELAQLYGKDLDYFVEPSSDNRSSSLNRRRLAF